MRILFTPLKCITFAVICVLTTPLVAQNQELQSGLLANYVSGQHNTQRIDPDILFVWDIPQTGEVLSKQVTWTGQILIRDTVPYRFHAELCGEVTIQIDEDTIVLNAQRAERSWVDGEPVEISPGFHDIKVTTHFARQQIQKQTDLKRVLKLYWSTDLFPVEPIPANLLFHEAEDASLSLIEEGRQLFEAHRCHRCHAGTPDSEVLPAPALWGVTEGMNPEWLMQKLLDKNYEATHSKMPNFGFTREDAECVSAYLLRQNSPFEFESVPKQKPGKDDPDGTELLHSLGCLACHQVNDLGSSGPFGGGDLSQIGAKRSPEWLATWLDRPERMNPQHRMPVFKLTPSERRLLVETLSKLGGNKDIRFSPKEKPSSIKAERGRQLMKDYRCANCHKIPAVEADLRNYPDLSSPVEDWEQSCLGEKADPANHRPTFSHTNKAALKAYLKSQFNAPRKVASQFTRGERVLERRNCLACHRRGTGSGNVKIAGKVAQQIPSLKGQSQALIPPSLTAVGDKLTDKVFVEALSGNHDRARANWLKVQMPKFHHTDEELAALQTYLVEHDRIPSAGVPKIPEVELATAERVLVGRRLVGAGGFSCIACHQVGEYVPKNVALGTRGSNLLNIQSRIRPEFYHRWTRAPLRVVTGMEMPSYQKPIPGVLDGHIETQLAALWTALGDPEFTPPTNPTQVEQLLQLQPGDKPKVVRDVFTVDEKNGGDYAARAFAMGFDNQHSLLFDIDLATIREWRFGDFARERTEGKSWFWDLAGVQLKTGFDTRADLVLLKNSSIINWLPQDPARIASLQSYQIHDDHISYIYEIKVIVENTPVSIEISETTKVENSADQYGLRRTITAKNIPTGYALGWRHSKLASTYITAEVNVADQPDNRLQIDEEQVSLFNPGADTSTLSVTYSAQSAPLMGPQAEIQAAYPDDSRVTTFPGYVGTRLKLPISIMPTAITWDHQQHMVFTSLKGHVYRAIDKNKDGLEETLEMIEEGLPAPFGILADGKDLLIGDKAELLRLHSPDTTLQYQREIVADGWGYTENYHDWLTGPVRDHEGNLYVATGSDYSQPKRDRTRAAWRGKMIKVDTAGNVSPFAHELRYPQGIAIDAHNRLFVSDQQGVQNTQNEINHVRAGKYYGVPAQLDEQQPERETRAAVQVPHPWTRSVNGIFFLPDDLDMPYAGHGVGCEYNGKYLIRFSFQEVDGELQGATYPLTNKDFTDETETFLGPICGAVSPSGDIYIGSIFDSGWLGGPNVGEIVRLRQSGEFPNGIQEVRATSAGFEIEFVKPVDATKSLDKGRYSINGSTWVWQGSYATPQSGTYSPEIQQVKLSEDGRTVVLSMNQLKPKFVYEINVGDVGSGSEKLFPTFATYSMNQLVP